MSKPSNPLSEYASYSYHHILVACSNSDVADELAETTRLDMFTRRNPNARYGAITTSKGKYVVILNSMVDAEFYIEKAMWGSIYVPTSSGGGETNDFNSTEQDGELVIVEPLGMRFTNVLASVASQLDIAAPAIVFLLKTIFIGNKPDGTVETISGIRPVVFALVGLSAEFEFTGSRYTISFVGGQDGWARHPGISFVSGGKNMAIDKGTTVTAALKTLENKINETYKARKEEIRKQTEKAGESFEDGVDHLPIKYEIIPDRTFDRMIAGANDPAGNGNSGDKDTIITFQPDVNISEAIKKIMESSPDLLKETSVGVEESGKNRKFTWNLTTDVRVTNTEVQAKYYVKYYELTTSYSDPNIPQGTDILPPSNHVIEWDYVYTGRNIDILEFKMEMDMAMAYFYELQMARSPAVYSQSEMLAGTTTENIPGSNNQVQGVGQRNPLSTSGKQKAPLMLGSNYIKNQSNKKTNAIETANARNVLASYAAMSTIGVKLQIAGNPILLENIKADATSDFVGPRVPTTAETTEEFTTDFSRIPGYAKINIKMPAEAGSGMVYENFWYEGYYQILSIQHNFEGGEFTQEVELFSIPNSSPLSDKTATSGKAPDPKAAAPIDYTETALTAVSGGLVGVKNIEELAYNNGTSPVLLSKYDAQIVAAATKYNVDPNVMRALFKTESNFNPNAVSGVGAAGLGQLMPATANEVGVRVDFSIDERFDVDKNIDGSTKYLSRQLKTWNGDVNKALASYNAGAGNVRKYGRPEYGGIPGPNFARGETYNYVQKINKLLATVTPATPTVSDTPVGPRVEELSPISLLDTVKGYL